MDLKDIFVFFKHDAKNLVIFLVAGGLAGSIVFLVLPKKYVGQGTFFISRKVSENSDFYTYSGYYDQQVALSYTKTVKGLLESGILHAKALEVLGDPVSEKNLRKLRQKIRVTDAGPQLVGLEVRTKTPRETEQIWKALALNLEETFSEITKETDTRMKVQQLKEEPVVKETYRELYLFGLVGMLLSFGAGTVILGLKVYMEGTND